jgi:hypothetical protein
VKETDVYFMIDRIQKLIGDNEVLEVEITQGLGGFPYKSTHLTHCQGMDSVRIGANSLLFLATKGDFTEESYMTLLTIPEDIEIISNDTEKDEITGSNFTIVGHAGSLIFKIFCKKAE